MTAHFYSGNFRTEDGIWAWQRLMAEREAEQLDVPRMFFAVFDRPAPISERMFYALGGTRVNALGGAPPTLPPLTPKFYRR